MAEEAEKKTSSQKAPNEHKSLMDFIEDEEAEHFEVDNPYYRIRNNGEADAKIARYHRLKRDLESIEEEADKYLAKKQEQVTEWKEKASAPILNEMSFLESILRDYAEIQLAGTGKKSLKLVEGSLAFRKATPSYRYDDEALRTFLMKAPDGAKFLKAQPPKVDKTALKKAGDVKDGKLYLDGEQVDGVEVETQSAPTFSIK